MLQNRFQAEWRRGGKNSFCLSLSIKEATVDTTPGTKRISGSSRTHAIPISEWISCRVHGTCVLCSAARPSRTPSVPKYCSKRAFPRAITSLSRISAWNYWSQGGLLPAVHTRARQCIGPPGLAIRSLRISCGATATRCLHAHRSRSSSAFSMSG